MTDDATPNLPASSTSGDSPRVPPVEQLTPLELRIEQIRRRVGLVLAPVVFTAMLWTSFPSLSVEAHRLAAIVVTVVLLWVTEALPMPVTALLGAAGCVVLGVAPADQVFAPFADPLMFLFIGSFILARGIFVHRLDRRLAFAVLGLPAIGARPSRVLFAFGGVTVVMSAWISNTATTAMMFAIGMSILAFLFEQRREGVQINLRFATGLMLITSFSASIGGLATPIGTPPNIIGLGFIRRELGVEIPFFQWMLLGVPLVAVLYLFMYAYLNFLCPAGVRELPGSQELLAREYRRLGPWTMGQISTVVAFGLTVVLWLAPGVVALRYGQASPLYQQMRDCMPEGVAALLGASLLFLLPGNKGERAIGWRDAAQIDWGVVLLYGGGFALGTLANETGLANAVGVGMTQFLPLSSSFWLLVSATLVATLTSEATSNTASANIVVPVVISIATAAGIDPLPPALGATFGSSLGFMLPVSTPCNAIVYGSGYIPIGRMIRYGLLLDLAGVVVVVTLVSLIAPWLR